MKFKVDFSVDCEKAIVRPLLKKAGLDMIPKNYRPVSNLCYLSKVLEKSMLKRFMTHCTKQDLIPSYQSTYLPNRSCETSILKVVNDILWAFEKKQSVALIALDLNAAFDTVDHTALLQILEKEFGISKKHWHGLVATLVTTTRSYVVKINNSCSESQDLCFSVLQGSVAGPSLYWAYASPIKEVVSNHEVAVNGFADDHALLKGWTSGSEVEEGDATSKLELCLHDV